MSTKPDSQQAEREAAEFAAEKEFWRVIGHSPSDDEAWAFQEFEFAVEAKARAAGRAEVMDWHDPPETRIKELEGSLRDVLRAHDALLIVHAAPSPDNQVRYGEAYDRLQAARALSTSTEPTI